MYREASLKDLMALRCLGIKAYGEFGRVLEKKDWLQMEGFLHDLSAYQNLLKISTCFVCTHHEKIIGVAYFVPRGNPTDIFDASWSYIRMVGVDPEYTRQGIAKKLTKMCIEKVNNTNEKILALHTSEFMSAARSLYEKLGFKQVIELAPLFGKRYWLYQLEL